MSKENDEIKLTVSATPTMSRPFKAIGSDLACIGVGVTNPRE
jgi:hypothetical protein